MPSKLKVHGALLLVGLIYGANYSIAKAAMPDLVGPFGFILIRAVTGVALFWGFSLFAEKERIEHRRDYVRLIVCAFFGICFNQLIFFKGLVYTNPIQCICYYDKFANYCFSGILLPAK